MDGMGSGVGRVQKQSCSESAETYFSMNSFEIFCSYLGLMKGPKTKQICFVNCSSRQNVGFLHRLDKLRSALPNARLKAKQIYVVSITCQVYYTLYKNIIQHTFLAKQTFPLCFVLSTFSLCILTSRNNNTCQMTVVICTCPRQNNKLNCSTIYSSMQIQ